MYGQNSLSSTTAPHWGMYLAFFVGSQPHHFNSTGMDPFSWRPHFKPLVFRFNLAMAEHCVHIWTLDPLAFAWFPAQGFTRYLSISATAGQTASSWAAPRSSTLDGSLPCSITPRLFSLLNAWTPFTNSCYKGRQHSTTTTRWSWIKPTTSG